MKSLAKGRRRERAKKRRSDLVFVIWRSRLERWNRRRSRQTAMALRCACGGIVIWRSRLHCFSDLPQSPVSIPEVWVTEGQFRVARDHGASVRPSLGSCHQAGAHRIVGNIVNKLLERMVVSFVGSQYMIMRLRLPAVGGFSQDGVCVLSQKPHEGSLIPLGTPTMNE